MVTVLHKIRFAVARGRRIERQCPRCVSRSASDRRELYEIRRVLDSYEKGLTVRASTSATTNTVPLNISIQADGGAPRNHHPSAAFTS
jgi:hypothetical protein